MQLDPLIRDYRGFLNEFIEAVEAEGTLFYLDTSLLMWLLRLAPAPRKEFIRWCEARPTNVVRVPLWAAHELHRHITSDTVVKSLEKSLGDTEAKYSDFARLASECADEATCMARGFAGRTSYIGQVEQSMETLRQLKKVISIDRIRFGQAADEVTAFVNERILASDLNSIVEWLSCTGDFRFSHRIPPGFQDKKDENRYGDVIIWEEILRDFKAAGPDFAGKRRNAIFLSRDQKTDWASSAKFVISVRGIPEKINSDQELDVVLAHPFLAHEFAHRAGGKKFYIASPDVFSSMLDFAARQRGVSSDINQLFLASHRPQWVSQLASIKFAEALSSRAPNAPPTPPNSAPQSPLPPSQSNINLETVDAPTIMSANILEELAQYETGAPLEQPLVYGGWEEELLRGDMTPVKFGRLVAELATRLGAGWAESVPAILESLSARISGDLLNVIALAIATSAYFDRYGELLSRPTQHVAQVVLLLETDSRLKPAFVALNRLLTESDANLPYTPGASRAPVQYVVHQVQDSQSNAIQDIRIGGHSALAHALNEDNPRRLSMLLGKSVCKGVELRMLIAREYLIPTSLLAPNYDKNDLTWPDDVGLVNLDTESDGGLSALADEGE